MSDSDIYDITKYTDNQLYDILDLTNPSDRELEAKILHLINKYSNMENESGYTLAIFFQGIYNHFFDTEEDDNESNEAGTNESNENSSNNNPNENIEGFTSASTALTKTEGGPVTNIQPTIQFDYTKDKLQLNPLLKQTIKRIISIDSQYRDKINPMTTEFTFNLSEPLRDVVSIKLYSVQIPYTWYTISNSYGSNFFYLKGNTDGINNELHDYKISVPAGNYNAVDLVSKINESFVDVSNTYTDVNFGNSNITYNFGNTRSTINLDIQKVYNETYFDMSWNYIVPSVSTILSDVSLNVSRLNSIPSYFGFNYSNYKPYTISSLPYYQLTSTITTDKTLYTLDGSNNYFEIIQYLDTNDLAYNSSSTILNTIRIQILDGSGSYYRSEIVAKINTALQTNDLLIDSSIIQIDSVSTPQDPSGNNTFNYGYSYYRMQIKLNRNKIKPVANSKITIVFPPENTNTDILKRDTIWTQQTGVHSCLFFETMENELNTIYAELPSIQSNFVVDSSTNIYFKCISPANYKTTRDFSMNDFTISMTPGNYILNNFIDEINSGITSANIKYGNILTQNATAYIDVYSKFTLQMDIINNFDTTKYKISYDASSVLCYLGMTPKLNYDLYTQPHILDSSFLNQSTGYIIDTSYILTFQPNGTAGNKNDISYNIFLEPQPGNIGKFSYPSYTELLKAIQNALTKFTITSDLSSNSPTPYKDIQTPFSNTTLVGSLQSNNMVKATLNININYALTENSYEIYFNYNSNNPWTLMNVDASYNICDLSSVNNFSTIRGKSAVYTNSIDITNQNNILTLTPYYDPSGGAYSTTNKNVIKFTIPEKQYSRDELITTFNLLFASDERTFGSFLSIYVKNNKEYVKLRLNINVIYTSKDYKLVFYDTESFVKCYVGVKSVRNTTWDSTLGWILGFRDYTEYDLIGSSQNVDTNAIPFHNYYLDSAQGTYEYADVYGTVGSTIQAILSSVNSNIISKIPILNTKINITGDTSVTTNLYNYFLIVLDDYIQNHLNDGLVSITKAQTSIPSPNYSYKSTTICDPATQTPVVSSAATTNGLTQKQIYALNQAAISKRTAIKSYSKGPYVQDVFAMIPLRLQGLSNGQYFVESSGTLQNQERLYFGPVNIHRMTIQLVNDRGDLVDLNKNDWSFSLICEQLYRS